MVGCAKLSSRFDDGDDGRVDASHGSGNDEGRTMVMMMETVMMDDDEMNSTQQMLLQNSITYVKC